MCRPSKSRALQPSPNMATADQNKVNQITAEPSWESPYRLKCWVSWTDRAGLKINWTICCCYMDWGISSCLLSSLKVIWVNLVQTVLTLAAQHPCNRELLIPNGSLCGTALDTYKPEIKLQPGTARQITPSSCNTDMSPILEHNSACYKGFW